MITYDIRWYVHLPTMITYDIGTYTYVCTLTYIINFMLCICDNVCNFFILVNPKYKQQHISFLDSGSDHAHFYPHICGSRKLKVITMRSYLSLFLNSVFSIQVKTSFSSDTIPRLKYISTAHKTSVSHALSASDAVSHEDKYHMQHHMKTSITCSITCSIT